MTMMKKTEKKGFVFLYLADDKERERVKEKVFFFELDGKKNILKNFLFLFSFFLSHSLSLLLLLPPPLPGSGALFLSLSLFLFYCFYSLQNPPNKLQLDDLAGKQGRRERKESS